MFQPFKAGAVASTRSFARLVSVHLVRACLFLAHASDAHHGSGFSAQPSRKPRREKGRHVVYGSPYVVQSIIKTLHHLNYAEPNEWSRPMPTEGPGEVMCILTQSVRLS